MESSARRRSSSSTSNGDERLDPRPREGEGRALPAARLDPHAAAGGVDHLLHHREADARPLDVHVLEPLEDLEDLVVVRGLDPDAVVPDVAFPGVAALAHADLDPRGGLAGVLDRVAQQVAEDLLDLRAIAPERAE